MADDEDDEEVDIPTGPVLPNPCAGGSQQSPINFESSSVKSKTLPELIWGDTIYEVPERQKIICTGHTLIVKATCSSKPTISGGPLQNIYHLDHIHYHWGKDEKAGSEHTSHGQRYPMEVHAVFTKNGMSVESALGHKDGLAVFGNFIDVLPPHLEKKKDKSSYDSLSGELGRLQKTNTGIQLQKKFPMSHLINVSHYNYFTYPGSLTTANYNEVVTWIFSEHIIQIHRKNFALFRKLYARHLMHDADNYREVQALCGRTVEFVPAKNVLKIEPNENEELAGKPVVANLFLSKTSYEDNEIKHI